MSGITSPHSYPNDHWSEEECKDPSFYSSSSNEQSLRTNAFLYPIDESEEFHDPFSDLNLYLSKKVKQSIKRHGTAKKWSSHIQADLLNKILPEFRLKFPRYRLGLSALKKVWEKVMYYSEKVESQKDAIGNDGKVNIAYMIKENLRRYPFRQTSVDIHPSNYAYQLAVKMSECIATLDGERPILDRLTKTIWSVQKHLMPKAAVQKRSPFEQYDTFDKLIVKTMLEITSKKCHLTQADLQDEIKQSLQALEKIVRDLDDSQLPSIASVLLAKKLYKQSLTNLHITDSGAEKMSRFIKRQFSLCPKPKTVASSIYQSEMVRRIADLTIHMSNLSSDVEEKTLKSALEYIYNLATKRTLPSIPPPNEELLNFINAQLSFIKQHFDHFDFEEIYEIISLCYTQAINLPQVDALQRSDIEVLIWSIIAEIDSEFQSLPPRVMEIFEEEIASIYLENPQISFQKCIQNVSQFFKKIRNLTFTFSHNKSEDTLRDVSNITDLEHKIYNWSLQNDLICAKINFEESTPLLKLIETEWESMHMDEKIVCHDEFIENIKNQFLSSHPETNSFSEELVSRIWILYKFFWYSVLAAPSESSYDRFLKWHYVDLKKYLSKQSKEQLITRIGEISSKILPLTPFSPGYLSKIT